MLKTLFVFLLLFLFLSCSDNPAIVPEFDSTPSEAQSVIKSHSTTLLPNETATLFVVVKNKDGQVISNGNLDVSFFIKEGENIAQLSDLSYDEAGTYYHTTLYAKSTGKVVVSAKIDGKELKTSPVTIYIQNVLSKPRIIPNASYYEDGNEVDVRIVHSDENVKIYYTLDGEDPSPQNAYLYTGTFTVTTPGTIKAVAYSDDPLVRNSEINTVSLSENVEIDFSEDVTRWHKIYDTGGTESFWGIYVDNNNGDVYVAGEGYRLVASDTNYDSWIKRFDKDGNELLDIRIDVNNAKQNDRARAVAVYGDYIYVAGDFYNNTTGNRDWWIKRFNKDDGTEDTSWSKIIDGGGNDYVNDLTIDDEGNIYVAGQGEKLVDSTSRYDAWIKKFKPDGTEEWEKKIDFRNNDDKVKRLKFNKDGFLFVVFDAYNALGVSTSWDVVIKKYAKDGSEDIASWNKCLDIGVNDYGADVSFDSFGNVYVIGHVGGVFSGGLGVFVKKFSPDGDEDTLHWNKLFILKRWDNGSNVDSRGMAIVIDEYDNVYIAGMARDINRNGAWDLYIKKYDIEGREDTYNFDLKLLAYGDDFIYSKILWYKSGVFIAGRGNNNAFLKRFLITYP